jgi:NAD(P)-dependent dehydrogenase (short-subunit alcohol dehydrogenase family)
MTEGFTEADVTDQSGKVAFITGANSGLGFEVARVLATKGARVLMGCRSREKADEAKGRVLEVAPEADVDIVDLDLGDLASVRAAAERVRQEPRLDLLINNAGVMMCPRSETTDGFERQIGVNHLGHFALTGLLLGKLEESAAAHGQARVVITSSNGHRFGKIDFDDFNAEKHYSRMGRYGMSKLANLLHMYELDRRLRARDSEVIAVGVHPGGSRTDLGRHMKGAFVFMPLSAVFTSKPPEGAWSTLLAATGDDVEGGQYFGPGGFREFKGPARRVESNALSHDEALAKRLWDLSVEKTGVDPGL